MGFFSVIVKGGHLMQAKKSVILMYCLIFLTTIILITGCVSSSRETETTITEAPEPGEPETAQPTPAETSGSTPKPKETLEPEKGECWLILKETTIQLNTAFTSELHINTENQNFAAYGIKIKFDPAIVAVETKVGTNGVEAGPDGFVTVVNTNKNGEIMIAGFNPSGKKGGKNLHAITIHWNAIGKGVTRLEVIVNDLVDSSTATIGTLKGRHSTIEVK
jgi:hypothetical protein